AAHTARAIVLSRSGDGLDPPVGGLFDRGRSSRRPTGWPLPRGAWRCRISGPVDLRATVARHSREWRNRQTRTVQVRVPERAWGFDSPLAHPMTKPPDP